MSLTPIERDGDRSADGSSSQGPAGVWGRVRSAVRRLVSRLVTPGREDGPTESEGASTGTMLRVPTESETPKVPVRADESTQGQGRPPTPGEQTGVETERDGQILRVHDPDKEDAYLDSDTWSPVER